MYIERSRKFFYTEFLLYFRIFEKKMEDSNRREILIEIGNMSGNFRMKFVC